jgi:hypothetical protein
MIKFLRRNQQVFILFIFLYAIFAVFSIYFIRPFTIYSAKPLIIPFLPGFIEGLIRNQNVYFLASFFALLIVLFIGFYLVRIAINYLIIPNRSQFAALFYIAISSFGYKLEMFSGAIVGSLFLLFAIDRVFSTINKKAISFRFIDAGILLSLGSIFYFNLLFLLPFLWLSQLTLRSNYRKELLFSIIGLLLPFVYIFSACFLFDKSVSVTLADMKSNLVSSKAIHHSWLFITGIGFYILAIVIASFFAIRRFATTKIQVRKLYQLLFYLFLNVLAIYIFIPSAGDELFFIISIPLSALLSIYFAECRNSIFNSMLFVLLMSLPVVINFLT